MNGIKKSREIVIDIGRRVRLIQQIPHGSGCWRTQMEGIVLGLFQEKTGAWYAHSKDKKLWLDRIEILQDSQEVSKCILDQYSRIELA